VNRSTLKSLSIVVASTVACLWPAAAGAQSAPAAALTVEDMRTQFASQGYQVSAPITWWTSDHVTTFTVADGPEHTGGQGRVVMVFVYPDLATAQAERERAQSRESVDAPHLVPGYGPSTWQANVALVQSTQQELQRQYAAQVDRDVLAFTDTNATVEPNSAPVQYAVDLDFLGVPREGLVNL
jgi:hypothetical protein